MRLLLLKNLSVAIDIVVIKKMTSRAEKHFVLHYVIIITAIEKAKKGWTRFCICSELFANGSITKKSVNNASSTNYFDLWQCRQLETSKEFILKRMLMIVS